MKIMVARSKLYPSVARPGPAWRWLYYYRVDGGKWIEYGTHLASLRGFFERRYAGAEIIFDWK